jgi:hypothetical protein
MDRRITAMEDHIEERVEERVRERVEEEISALLDQLEQKLPDAEFRRVLEIASKMDQESGDE